MAYTPTNTSVAMAATTRRLWPSRRNRKASMDQPDDRGQMTEDRYSTWLSSLVICPPSSVLCRPSLCRPHFRGQRVLICPSLVGEVLAEGPRGHLEVQRHSPEVSHCQTACFGQQHRAVLV